MSRSEQMKSIYRTFEDYLEAILIIKERQGLRPCHRRSFAAGGFSAQRFIFSKKDGRERPWFPGIPTTCCSSQKKD